MPSLVQSHGLVTASQTHPVGRRPASRRRALWKTKESVELATLEWVAWFNLRIPAQTRQLF